MKTKHPRARIQIIDRELSKNKFVRTKDLKKIISNETLPITQRTIQKDIELMKENRPVGYAAPIGYNSKKKAYYYTDTDFTIQAFGLKEEDIMALIFYAKTLEQYRGVKIFKDILTAIEKVLENFDLAKKTREVIMNRTLLQTEKIIPIKGVEFIEKIIKAILANQKIIFDYKKFDSETTKRRTLSPVMLKEEKHFWYVIGILDDKQTLTTFALDRMSNLFVTNQYFKQIPFDPELYFKHSLGVTVEEKNPIEVVLSFKVLQGNYIKTLPIHESQKILKDNEKELQISIQVKPTYEFYSKILGYGSDVKVISPRSVAKEVKQRLQAALKNYN
jgi:predicted DNA-binding transcriptional regulator YafY